MAQIRGPRFWYGWAIAIAAVFLTALYLLTFWGWEGGTADPYTRPPDLSDLTASPSATAQAVVHPAPLEARPLDEETVAVIEDGWLLVEYDTSAGDYAADYIFVTPAPDPTTGVTPPPSVEIVGDEATWDIPGETFLYVVAPGGEMYQSASLGEASPYSLEAWLPDRRTAIVSNGHDQARTLHSFDLLTGDVSSAFAGPAGEAQGTWINPDVKVAGDGEALVVQHGDEQLAIALLELSGSFIVEAVPPTAGGVYIQGPYARWFFVRDWVEGIAGPAWGITHWGPVGDEPDINPIYEQIVHGTPPGERNCYPGTWPEGRQLILWCARDDGTTALWTVAVATNTFVEASIIEWSPTDGIFEFDSTGTRIATSRIMFDVFGQPVWVLPTEAPQNTHLLWVGDAVAMWGEDEPEDGFGAQYVRVHDGSSGEIAYLLEAIEGASGFHGIVPATP